MRHREHPSSGRGNASDQQIRESRLRRGGENASSSRGWTEWRSERARGRNRPGSLRRDDLQMIDDCLLSIRSYHRPMRAIESGNDQRLLPLRLRCPYRSSESRRLGSLRMSTGRSATLNSPSIRRSSVRIEDPNVDSGISPRRHTLSLYRRHLLVIPCRRRIHPIEASREESEWRRRATTYPAANTAGGSCKDILHL